MKTHGRSTLFSSQRTNYSERGFMFDVRASTDMCISAIFAESNKDGIFDVSLYSVAGSWSTKCG